jgi:L-ribulose-5-phosphate 3-epimerase
MKRLTSVIDPGDSVVDRRQFLRTSAALALGLGSGLPALAAKPEMRTPSAEKLGWQASVQLYTYRRFALFDALEQVAAVGLRRAEVRTGLRLDAKRPALLVNEDLPADARRQLKTMLEDRGDALASVFADFTGKPDQARRVFEFCQQLGAGLIVAEPPANTFDMLEKLCEEFRLPLAIHNHQQGQSQYWSPERVLAVCKGRSPRIGACCDGGQWARSGLDPVECLRQLQGRILSFHLKDIAKKGDPQSRNTVIGEGEGDCARTLKELKRLGYRGLVTIDFEHDTPALQEDMARNVAFVEAQARQLLPG